MGLLILCFPHTKSVKEVAPSVWSELGSGPSCGNRKDAQSPVTQCVVRNSERRVDKEWTGWRQARAVGSLLPVGGFQMTLGHSYLFTVLSYLSSKLPKRTLSCLPLDLACFGSLFYFIYLFFGGFGFLHLTEQALALAE